MKTNCIWQLSLLSALLWSSRSRAQLQDFRPTVGVPEIHPHDNNFKLVLDSINQEIYRAFLVNPLHLPNPAVFQGPAFLKLYCQNHRVVRIDLQTGYAHAYCANNRNDLSTVIYDSLQKEGLEGEEKKKTGLNAAYAVLQRYGFVPICARHCPEGTRPSLAPGNYTSPMYKTYFSVGCPKIYSSSCTATCSDDIYQVENGRVECTMDSQIRSVCSLHCKHGYVAVGPKSKTCDATRLWDEGELFRCLLADVGNAIKHEMKSKGLSFNEALTQLREKLENFLKSKISASPNTRRESTRNIEQQLAETDMAKIMEEMLVKLSRMTALTLKRFNTCAAQPKERRNCGWGGISEQQCKQNDCCWDSTHVHTYWCFYKTGDIRQVNHSTATTTKPPRPKPKATENKPLLFQNNLHDRIIALHGLLSHSQPQHDFNNQVPNEPEVIPNPGVPEQHKEKCGCVTDGSRCLNMPMAARVACGLQTTVERWPWHAVVSYHNYMCGGALIGKDYVVTAAHCVTSQGFLDSIPESKVYLGLSDRAKQEDALQIRVAKRIIRHPLFYSRGSSYVQNDIAIIQLSEPVKQPYTASVRPICLPGKSSPTGNGKCYITGFGKTSASAQTASQTLKFAAMPLVAPEQCSSLYSSFNPVQNICAGFSSEDSPDACKGDSGGPLVCQRVQGDSCSWYLAGITSFGTEPCGENPGVYVDVSHYEYWIRSHIQPHHGR